MNKVKKILSVVMVLSLAIAMTSVAGRAAGKTVRLNKTKAAITVGKKLQLKVMNLKKGQKVSWSSSNKKVAAVSNRGKVTAKKIGTANIIAKIEKKKYICKIAVKGMHSDQEEPSAVPTRDPDLPDDDDPAVEPTKNPDASNVPAVTPVPDFPASMQNAEDVAALKKIIASQKERGALVSENIMDAKQYEWDSFGRLVEIEWDNIRLSGEISFSGLAALRELDCDNNQLTGLDVSGCTALTDLSCKNNQLISLDVSGKMYLDELDCSGNQLISLNISGCTCLEELECRYNQLTSLDVSGCIRLEELKCDNFVNIIRNK